MAPRPARRPRFELGDRVTVELTEIATAEAKAGPEGIAKVLHQGVAPDKLILLKNVRPVDLDDEFLDSIREHGLLQPIVAAPYEDGRYAVLFGNRRAAGVQKVGCTADVIVRNDLTEDSARIVAQLVENLHREDMRPSEVAAACAQLAIDLGLSEDQIAKKIGKKKKDVRASLALHGMPTAAKEAADAGQLDLETAAALSAFEADPKAYNRLMKASQDGRLPFALKEEERKRERAIEKAERTATLMKAGVAIIPKPSAIGYGSREVRLTSLRNEQSEPMTAERHATCPGHAAYFDSGSYEAVRETYVCRDPKRYGHTVSGYYSYQSPEEVAAQEAAMEQARREQQEREEAMAIARELREEFIRGLCRSKKTPRGVVRFALEVLFEHGFDQKGAALSFLGAAEAEEGVAAFSARLGRYAETRQPLAALALAAAEAEENITRLSRPYRSGDTELALKWLNFLSGHGYELSDPEQEFAARLQEVAAEEENEPEDWDEDDEEDQGVEEEPESAEDQGVEEEPGSVEGQGVEEDGLEGRYPEINEPIAA